MLNTEIHTVRKQEESFMFQWVVCILSTVLYTTSLGTLINIRGNMSSLA